MGRGGTILSAGCLMLALFSDISARAQPQPPSAPSGVQSYEAIFAKARDECKTLWSDHALDALRSKIPLGEEKPTFSMLTNVEKLRPKDRPLADLAIH
jgi:hypothetical protein